jgi:restriction system protein
MHDAQQEKYVARKRKTGGVDVLFDILVIAPAWFGPVLAGGMYLVLRFLLPAIFAPPAVKENPFGAGMAIGFGGFCVQAAPWAFMLTLLVWVAAEIYKRRNRRLLDKQEGVDTLRNLSWHEFERLVGEAYRRKGYLVEETGNPVGDGGVDLVLSKGSEVVLVQCKQWKAWKVGVKPVRELLGVVASRKARAGILVTSGRFTEEARDFSRSNPIQLLDGPALASLIAEVQGKDVPVKEEIAKPATPTAAQDDVPPCPRCGASMVRRTAGRGQHAGKPFWGCSKYPACKGIVQAK